MALKLKYTDEHGILQIDMSPSSSPREDDKDISDPKFDTINNRFGQYDLFGGKYDYGGDTPRSLFRSRYNSIEEELANTPYAFATERSLRLTDHTEPVVDITIDSRYESKDLEDDRFFRDSNIDIEYGLFGPQIDYASKSSVTSDETPAFTVTQLIHAQDRYFDLSTQKSKNDPKLGTVKSLASNFEVRSAPGSAKRTVKVVDRVGSLKGDKAVSREAFKVLSEDARAAPVTPTAKLPVVPTPKKKKETSFAIIAETPTSRPTSPKSLPVEIRPGRVSPFKGRGFREETSRHNTPKTSAANSRSSSPPRRRTNSLSKIDKMATATLPLPVHLNRPHSPRNFLKENIEEIRELSELNREKNEAEAEQRRREEEEALLKEMGLIDKKDSKSRVNSRTNSRSNSPIKIKIKSRSNSPSAVLYYENISTNSSDFVNADDIPSKPVAHRSRLRSVSRSQPQSNNGSPKHSKIPQRQNSVSPVRNSRYDIFTHRRPFESNLSKNQRFISNSTSSIHETIKIGSKVHDKRSISKSTQHLDISPAVIKSKPPISPSRGGPPPSNKSINAKRLSPIVGTPSKGPLEDTKSGPTKTSSKPTPAPRKPVKTAGNTPASTSRINSKAPSRATSRDTSPDKKKTAPKPPAKSVNNSNKPVSRVASSKTAQKPPLATNKVDAKKPINRTNSTKSLIRTSSSKTLNEKPPMLKKKDSKKDLMEKSKSTGKVNEIGIKNTVRDDKGIKKGQEKGKGTVKVEETKADMSVDTDEVSKQDNETQYDKTSNTNSELVILTKKNIVSMTTAAITSQPLEVVATVTNQLPTTFEKAREKGIFERLNSKDALVPKEEEVVGNKEVEEKEKIDKIEKDDKKPPPKPPKSNSERSTVFSDDNVKLRLLQPPYNNPQVERVKQKIDDILKEPEISTENILAVTPKAKQHIQNTVDGIKSEVIETINDDIQLLANAKDDTIKKSEEITAEIRSEASKIVDSIITPVEEPKEIVEKSKAEVKEIIEPIVTVVNEKKNGPKTDVSETVNETLVKGDAEAEVQSSNLSTPAVEKLAVPGKIADGNESDKSGQSNGGFPQSTSTTPKPPARAHRQPKEEKSQSSDAPQESQLVDSEDKHPKPNICQRLMGKCKTKCCTCCIKPQDERPESAEDGKREEMPREQAAEQEEGEKKSTWKNLNCCKKKEVDVEDIERAAGKAATIEFESETKRKRKLRDILCVCCRRRQVSDIAEPPQHVEVSPPVMSSDVVKETGCCGKKREAERRDSILSDRAGTTYSNSCCNNRLCRWLRGACRRQSEQSSSRRTSLFSKNKSLSPTLPPEESSVDLVMNLKKETCSKSVKAETVDKPNVSLPQSVTVDDDTSTVPLPQSITDIITSNVLLSQSVPLVVENSNALLPQPVSESVDASDLTLPQSVPVLDTPNEPLPQSVTVVGENTNLPLQQSETDVDTLKEEPPKLKSENVESIKLALQDIQPDTEDVNTSCVAVPKSVAEVVDILIASSDHPESEIISRLNVPSPQSESEIVHILNEGDPKSNSENVNNLPSQSIELDSETETINLPLPQSIATVTDNKNESSIQVIKLDVLDNNFIDSSKLPVIPELVDTSPTIQSVNLEEFNSVNQSSTDVANSELNVLNELLPVSVDDDKILKVPSAQSGSSDSSKIVESLKVPSMDTMAAKYVHRYRKTKFEAIFDDDDDDDDDTRTKLDASLVEHTSVMRGAIPVLPIALAYFCLMCNVLVPGLGTIFSGMFCLCFGIPRFGVHDGAKHRIGSLVINLLVGCGQLFTVLFCLVGWGWSVWWGVIMVKIARKYRKLKAEAMADEAEAPPVTANNHTRA